jgi:L-histidine Nalpha-methyltransferase
MANFSSTQTDLTVSQGNEQISTNRLRVDYLQATQSTSDTSSATSQERAEVIAGLSQIPKMLSAQYFYDDRGSQLFEQICELPEYYLTRTEAAILHQYGHAIAQHTGSCEMVELGSGSSTKTRLLLNAYQSLDYPLFYRPIDVSAGMLTASAQALLDEYPQLKIHAIAGTYEQALQELSTAYLPRRMVMFLGSTLGNLSPDECDRFFAQISQALHPNDYFLLGVDLHKSTAQLEAAYNDSQGITAAFNLNILTHLNERFEGTFDLNQFSHQAFYNEALHQIEMHLCSLTHQTIQLKGLNFCFTLEDGETIRSEISRKFHPPTLQTQLEQHDLNLVHTWMDDNQWFGVMLYQKSP